MKHRTTIKNAIVSAEGSIALPERATFPELAQGISKLNQIRLNQITSLNTTISDLTKVKGNLESQIASLQSDKNGLQTQVSNLQNQVNNLNATIANLTKERDTLQSQVTSLNTSVSSLTNEKNSLQTQVNNLNNDVSSLTTQRNNLQTQVNNLNQNLRDERICTWAVARDLTGLLISSPDTYAVTKERLAAGLKGLTCYSKQSHVYNNGFRYTGTTIISPNKSFYPIALLITICSKTDSSIREQLAACRIPTGTWYCTSGNYYRISVDSSGDAFCNATSTDYRYMSFETEEYLIGMPT